ncbi:helix-hairpin-helix domain-containing protein [Rhodovibrio salinarum]|uniref:Helix-hairpin-helix domain-containing protein n=1 Tax=Rhodovibrio salinarum TaxID=1087 RepID=A0A934QH76_9PROT|nr:helix-hairpin-helix domain-containing protein [Rhodovibrio salinarum]MBK1696465.1 hypothetical protein [Rhodovibrio salinarum]
MIADFLRKGLDWARAFFWVSDSDEEQGQAAQGTARAQGVADQSATSHGSSAASRSSGQRRSAAEKTSTSKRGATGTKRTTTKSSATKSGAAKSGSAKTAAKGGAQNTAKSAGSSTSASGSASPKDITDIKGIGPAMKTKLAQLGITSFADLAGADADRVAKDLDSRTITAERVRGWIAEAKKHS